jgi:hypothetical protein
MLSKTTTKLFYKKYTHKVVVVCEYASSFRKQHTDEHGKYSAEDYAAGYRQKLMKLLNKIDDFDVRVENPLLSIYTNNKKDIDAIIKLNPENVKYTCAPAAKSGLADGVVIMPKMPFDFKVTIGSSKISHETFIDWADNNNKVKLTNSCRLELARAKSWGGTYFYVTGEKTLLMARMHLGSVISKVERIVKA